VETKNENLTILKSSKPPHHNTARTHYVYKITTKSGDAFAIDITGSQFGWSELVTPWKTYVSGKCSEIVAEHPLGHNHNAQVNPRTFPPYFTVLDEATTVLSGTLIKDFDERLVLYLQGFIPDTVSNFSEGEHAGFLSEVGAIVQQTVCAVDPSWVEIVRKISAKHPDRVPPLEVHNSFGTAFFDHDGTHDEATVAESLRLLRMQ